MNLQRYFNTVQYLWIYDVKAFGAMQGQRGTFGFTNKASQ